MAYAPKTIEIFVAAYAGALSGMGASDKVLTSQNSADYDYLVAVANSYAQSFDTNYDSTVLGVGTLQQNLAQSLSEALWQERSPNTAQAGQVFYDALTKPLVAIIKSAVEDFDNDGYNNPPLGAVRQVGTYFSSQSATLAAAAVATKFPASPGEGGADFVQVKMTVIPGNLVEVDWRTSLQAIAAPGEVEFSGFCVVTIAGTDYLIVNSGGSLTIANTVVDFMSASGLCNFIVPQQVPAVETLNITIVLNYKLSSDATKGGTSGTDTEAGRATSLKCTEYNIKAVVPTPFFGASDIGTLLTPVP